MEKKKANSIEYTYKLEETTINLARAHRKWNNLSFLFIKMTMDV